MGMAVKSVEKKLYKLLIGLLKVIPMILAILTIIGTMFDFFSLDASIFSFLGGMSVFPLLFIYLSSFAFGFCIYHRMFLDYVVVNNLVTYFDYYVGIPVEARTLFIFHLILIGIFLFFILFFYRRERCCNA